jgi:hypothetical protein
MSTLVGARSLTFHNPRVRVCGEESRESRQSPKERACQVYYSPIRHSNWPIHPPSVTHTTLCSTTPHPTLDPPVPPRFLGVCYPRAPKTTTTMSPCSTYARGRARSRSHDRREKELQVEASGENSRQGGREGVKDGPENHRRQACERETTLRICRPPGRRTGSRTKLQRDGRGRGLGRRLKPFFLDCFFFHANTSSHHGAPKQARGFWSVMSWCGLPFCRPDCIVMDGTSETNRARDRGKGEAGMQAGRQASASFRRKNGRVTDPPR